jgi:hypothetical protein
MILPVAGLGVLLAWMCRPAPSWGHCNSPLVPCHGTRPTQANRAPQNSSLPPAPPPPPRSPAGHGRDGCRRKRHHRHPPCGLGQYPQERQHFLLPRRHGSPPPSPALPRPSPPPPAHPNTLPLRHLTLALSSWVGVTPSHGCLRHPLAVEVDCLIWCTASQLAPKASYKYTRESIVGPARVSRVLDSSARWGG